MTESYDNSQARVHGLELLFELKVFQTIAKAGQYHG